MVSSWYLYPAGVVLGNGACALGHYGEIDPIFWVGIIVLCLTSVFAFWEARRLWDSR